MKIAVITGDHLLPDSEKREGTYAAEDFASHQAMVAAIKAIEGIECLHVFNDHANLLRDLRLIDVDLVVNFCDTGFKNIIKMETHIPTYLEMLEIPYTGSPPQAMIQCYDKTMVSLVANQLGIPVAQEIFVETGNPLPEGLSFPALIKPNKADGSFGITKNAVVKNKSEAQSYLEWLAKNLPGRDLLIQEYLPGPEYGVGVIGNQDDFKVLPALEVDFSALPKELAPILSYESKSHPDSPYWQNITFKKAELPNKEAENLAKVAIRLFERLGLRDYGRFDFRSDAKGIIKLMEVNPNPAWANDGKLAFMAAFADIDYPSMLKMIIDCASRRYPHLKQKIATSSIDAKKPVGKFGEVLGVAPGNVPVYSCDYSTARDEDFPDRKAYRSYLDGVFMGFKWQCVELARRWLYLNKGYIFEDVAMAYDIFNLRSVTSTVDHTAMPLHAFKNGAKRRPELGCLLIWDEGGEFEVTGHVAIVTEVGDEFIRFAEQNVDNSIWKPGRDYSRELKVKITDEGGYWVEPYYHDASILGWVIQTEDDTYALPPQKFDRSLLNLKVKKVDSASQPTTRWVDTSTAAGNAYVVALGHELVSNPEDFHRYFCLSDTAHQQLKRATNELHYLFLQATNHVLQNDDLLRQFNIPEPIWHKIKRSWENRRHETITGRFDFTVSERGIKVYEYNADSSSCYFESGRLQSEWAQFVGCRVGKCSGEALFEKLVATWKDSEVQGVLHIMQDDDKEESYHALFMQAAMEKAGITTKIIKGVRGLSWKGESVVDDCGVPINWVWKTWAWETALDQIRQQLVEGASGVPLDTGKSPRLVDVLLREQVLVFEPLWTLITSNKAILPVLWSLYPDHPFLLNSGFELTKPLVKGGYVTKPIVGRRGENISIVDHNESIVKEVGGQFGDRDKIYQELAPLPNVCGMNVQVCTFSVGGSYGGACVRVDPSPVITGESDLYPLRFMADKDWLSPAKG